MLWGTTLKWMWIPSIKEKIFNILMYGHVPQLPHYKQGCELFTAASRKGTFTSCCPRVNRLLASLRAAGCFLWHWLMRENVRMNNYCGFAACSVTTCASWSDSNESECSSLPAGFLLRDFVIYIKEGFLGAEVTLGQGSLCWLALPLIVWSKSVAGIFI